MAVDARSIDFTTARDAFCPNASATPQGGVEKLSREAYSAFEKNDGQPQSEGVCNSKVPHATRLQRLGLFRPLVSFNGEDKD